jgi:hypothetical protein
MGRKVENVENQSSECRWDPITIYANMMSHKKENVKQAVSLSLIHKAQIRVYCTSNDRTVMTMMDINPNYSKAQCFQH